MESKHLTLTAVGLPVRAELRLRSLMELIKSKTIDEWSFVEHGAADLAICNPASALAAVTLRRAAASGMHCVSLVEDHGTAVTDTSAIRDPIRASDLIDLLNRISSRVGGIPSTTDTPGTTADDEHALYPLAYALRALSQSDSQSVHLLQVESMALHVVPSTRTAFLSRPLSDADDARLAAPGIRIESCELPADHVHELVAAGTASCKIDTLLWRLGLLGANGQLLPELPERASFKLRRWPDFGRLPHTADHLRLAARMVRRESSIAEIATSVGVPPSSVYSFINACALCNLLQVLEPVATTEPVPARVTIEPTPRYAALFKTIRSALGFGASA